MTSTPASDEYQLAALWHHILPLANHSYSPECLNCGVEEVTVAPDHLIYLCPQCYPESHTDHLK